MTTETNKIKPEPIPETVPNHCPKCGADETELSFDSYEVEDGVIRYPFSCMKCGFSGEEIAELKYIGHWDEDGNQAGRPKIIKKKVHVWVFSIVVGGIMEKVKVFTDGREARALEKKWLKAHGFKSWDEYHDIGTEDEDYTLEKVEVNS